MTKRSQLKAQIMDAKQHNDTDVTTRKPPTSPPPVTPIWFTLAVGDPPPDLANRWIISTTATAHLTNSLEAFHSMETLSMPKPIGLFGGSPFYYTTRKGTVRLECYVYGQRKIVDLSDVYYCPSLLTNFLSVGEITNTGAKLIIDGGCEASSEGTVIFTGSVRNRLLTLDKWAE